MSGELIAIVAMGVAWADHANRALQRAGSQERITGASLERQYQEALDNGDELAAARLNYQVPGW